MLAGRSAILVYHSLDPSGSVISTSPAEFRRQMEILAECQAPVVTLEQARHVPGSVALTFDDGYANFLDHGLPVLQAYRFPATLFVITGHVGGRNDWDARIHGIPTLPMMGWKDLRELVALGIHMGGHTLTHPRLTNVADRGVWAELHYSRRHIQDETGFPVAAFAYPYGDCDLRVRGFAAREYKLACGIRSGFVNGSSEDAFELPRIRSGYFRGNWALRHLFGRAGGAYLRAREWVSRGRAQAV